MSQDYAPGSRPLIGVTLARSGIQADTVQEVGHPATLFPMVATGIGISILPALALPLPEGSLLVVRRITPVVERQLILVRRKSHSLFTAVEVSWDVVRDRGNALMAGREGDPLYRIQNEFILPGTPIVANQKLNLMEQIIASW